MKRLAGLLATVLLAAGPLAAGEADEIIANVLKRVRSAPQRPAALLKAARLVSDRPEVMVGILEKAVEFGLKAGRVPEAMAAAGEALDLLEEKAPQRADEWQEKRLAAARLAYQYAGRAGKLPAGRALLDALVTRARRLEATGQWSRAAVLWAEGGSVARAIRSPLVEWMRFQGFRARHFQSVAARIAMEKRKMAADPAAREKAIELLVVEMGDLPAARALLNEQVDQTWRDYLPLAERGPGALEEASAAELGRWYHRFLLPKASRFAQLRLLVAARSCYQRAVLLHKAQDAALVPLRLRLAEVEKQLEGIIMDPTSGGRSGEIDLLASLDLDQTDWKGAWGFVAGALTTWPREGGYLRVPAVIEGDYRLTVRVGNRLGVPVDDAIRQFRRLKVSSRLKRWLVRGQLKDRRGVDIAFPVGDRHLCLTLEPGRTDTVARLHVIEADPDAKPIPAGFVPLGEFVEKDELLRARGPAMPTERLHTVDIAVFVEAGVAAVTVHFNDKPLFRWRGAVSRCFLPEDWPLGKFRGQVLLGGWTGPSVFASAKVSTFGGSVRFVPFVPEE